ncbi:MAG TPA: EAL domain-containing protein [Acidobacteriaceae bacterium]|nr:EAL domain-containing protein [Acidobacteriaceae bacterium]
MVRHRTSIKDFSILIAVLLVGLYLVFEYDLFRNSDGVTLHQETVELDEALLLGGIMAIGLLGFSVRRYMEQRKESGRRRSAEQHIRTLAFQDALTGLPNRRQFDDALRTAAAALPREGAAHAVLLLDLNGFKQVNDIYGHAVGDQVLSVVAQRLLGCMRDGDLVARLGGDEFSILSQHLAGPEAATNIALRVIEALKEPISAGSTRHQIGAGIGIALIPGDASTPGQALRKADVALYRAKEERRSAVRFFEDEMDKSVQEREWLMQELRVAVAQETIQVFFQPSVNMRSKRIVSFEALPRWVHPSMGEIGSDRFIPIAEESGLIYELADQILRQACAAAAQWPDDVVLSVDVLASQLKDRKLKSRVLEILRLTGLPPHRLEIEITESTLVRNLEAAQEILGGLRDAGVRIALDNFGTGYSSLYHIRNFKMDKIKIDSSFIHGMLAETETADVVRALVGLGQGLGVTIAADGIQDFDQQASLLRSGCEFGQGFLYSGPVSAEESVDVVSGAHLSYRISDGLPPGAPTPLAAVSALTAPIQ